MAHEKKCTICGNQYHYCAKCEKIKGYRFYADTPYCYQIFTILREFRENVLTSEEATKKFNSIGIDINSDISNFIPAVERDIKSILVAGTKKKPKKVVESTVLTYDTVTDKTIKTEE